MSKLVFWNVNAEGRHENEWVKDFYATSFTFSLTFYLHFFFSRPTHLLFLGQQPPFLHSFLCIIYTCIQAVKRNHHTLSFYLQKECDLEKTSLSSSAILSVLCWCWHITAFYRYIQAQIHKMRSTSYIEVVMEFRLLNLAARQGFGSIMNSSTTTL